MTYEELEARIAQWAQVQPDIRAVIVIGSRARHDPDRWSDLDLPIFTTDPRPYAADPAWIRLLGEVWVAYLEITTAGDPEWFVVFAGGLKLNAVLMRIIDPTLDLDTLLKPYDGWDAFQRGARVLFDRSGAPRDLPPTPSTPILLPDAAAFEHVVSGFLMAAATTARFIMRGDYWRAHTWFTTDLRPHLLTMIRFPYPAQTRAEIAALIAQIFAEDDL